MIYTALIISLASLGFRAITGKGMILYFLREPFDKLSRRKSDYEKNINRRSEINAKLTEENSFRNNSHSDLEYELKALKTVLTLGKKPSKHTGLILYIMKPFILCGTCMASIHTLIWFPIITGEFYTYRLIIVMLAVALFNTLIWSFVEMMQKSIEVIQKSIDSDYE